MKKQYMFKNIIALLLLIFWAIIIFNFSNQPAVESAELSNNVLLEITKFLHISITEHALRKLAHFTEYMIFGILMSNVFYSLKGQVHIVLSIACCAIYSISDEIHQLFIVGRSCQITDMLIDTIGAIFGIFLIYIFVCFIKKKKIKEKNK